MIRFLPLLLTGCVGLGIDPEVKTEGYWDIEKAVMNGATKRDVGFIDWPDRGVVMLLRYTWSGAAFEPDPHPQLLDEYDSPEHVEDDWDGCDTTVTGGNNDRTVPLPWFSGKCNSGSFKVVDYTGPEMVLSLDSARWPTGTSPEPGRLKLFLAR